MKVARTTHINVIDAAPSAVPPIAALPRASRVPLSFSQQRLWFLSRLGGGSETCNSQMGLRLRGELEEAALQSALDALVVRHKVLRTAFGVEDGEPFQRIGPADVGLPLKRDDLTAAADVEAVRGSLIYATSLFERSTVERFARQLQQAVSRTVADPEQRFWSAPPQLAEERRP
ncbi:condensation domain-containing protein [Mesorhizobium sp. C280B]|uniref:condensation domain-containing protein n=1 Tax=unclassified Mesorhizobium TaxID=325217 RepID=UPI0003CE6163|nr:condensation domain-containing protein [Mesorhizobium sp. LSJC280B00]ESW77822.1 hypothetical protein X772_30395 [Mesorhizobium sp. LSJC280B00]